MVVTVDELLRHPFLNRTRQQKVNIILEGRPQPLLEKLNTPHHEPSKTGFNDYVIVFDPLTYKYVEWLTGCDLRQELFCWPCLLFRPPHEDTWNKIGLNNLSNLREKIRSHEISEIHIQSLLDLQLFTNTIDAEEAPPVVKMDVIEKNREIAKIIIDVICSLTSQQNHPQTELRYENVLEIKDCIANLKLLRNYSIPKSSNIDAVIETIEKCPKIVADMIEAIISLAKKEIKKELQSSTYVSVILSEHSNVCTESQISTVLRYLRNGEVCERYVDFVHIEYPKTPKAIYSLINKVIVDFQINQRVMAYSLDGYVLLNVPELHDLYRKLKCQYPHLHFVPCYFHSLNDVLLQSLSSFNEYDLFIKLISVLELYLQGKGNDCLKFENDSNFEVNNPCSMFRCSKFQPTQVNNGNNCAAYLNNIKVHRLSILKKFNEALENFHGLTDDEFVEIQGLCAFLTDFKNIFLLETFIKFFDDVVPLAEAFNSDFPGLAFDTNLINCILKSLDDEVQNDGVEKFWCKFLKEFCKVEKLKPSLFSPRKEACCSIFVEVMTCMKNQIRFRFEDSSKFNIFYILDFENSSKSLSADDVQLLNSNYGQVFDYAELKKEIKIINENRSDVTHESVHKLYKFLAKPDFGKSLENITRICEVLLTLPSTIPSVTKKSNMTKLDEITYWSYSSCEKPHGDISFLCIEQDYIRELRGKESFYNDVIKEFNQINKTFDF